MNQVGEICSVQLNKRMTVALKKKERELALNNLVHICVPTPSFFLRPRPIKMECNLPKKIYFRGVKLNSGQGPHGVNLSSRGPENKKKFFLKKKRHQKNFSKKKTPSKTFLGKFHKCTAHFLIFFILCKIISRASCITYEISSRAACLIYFILSRAACIT